MKMVNQNIPPELLAEFRKLVSTNLTVTGGVSTGRTRQMVNLSQKRKRKNQFVANIEKAVDQLIAWKKLTPGWVMPKDFRVLQIQAIKKGIFDEEYWMPTGYQDAQAIRAIPTYSSYTGARPYAYPDESNQPTRAIYGNGTNSFGNPKYTGSTIGGIFRDTLLRWHRIRITLPLNFQSADDDPLFLRIAITLKATANARPSRAMQSFIAKYWIVTADSSRKTTLEPPMPETLGQYWRYEQDSGTAPYYNKTVELEGIYYIRSKKREEQAAMLTDIIVLLAPMPMMGYRYNNNTSVQTEILGYVVQAWQLKKMATYRMRNAYWEAWYSPPVDYVEVNSIAEGITWMNTYFPDYAPYEFIASENNCSYPAPYQSMIGWLWSPIAGWNPQRMAQINRQDTTCGY